jgi:hypothetical protein
MGPRSHSAVPFNLWLTVPTKLTGGLTGGISSFTCSTSSAMFDWFPHSDMLAGTVGSVLVVANLAPMPHCIIDCLFHWYSFFHRRGAFPICPATMTVTRDMAFLSIVAAVLKHQSRSLMASSFRSCPSALSS